MTSQSTTKKDYWFVYCHDCEERVGKTGFESSARELARMHECGNVSWDRKPVKEEKDSK